jgi:hypothetical protein
MAQGSAMNVKHLLLFSTIAIALSGTARSQIVRPGVGPSNPNRLNQDLETRQQILFMDERRRAEEQRQRDAQSQQSQDGHGGNPARDQAIVQAQVAKFLKAIKGRKRRFADFDQVVTHGKAPVTPAMLGLMAESYYAADIAYYLGKHPEQSLAIAQMHSAEARSAVQQIESRIAAENAGRK